MKNFLYIIFFGLFSLLGSSVIFAGDNSSITFSSGGLDECSVMGQMVPLDEDSAISFTGTSSNSINVFELVKNKIEKGFEEEIEAEITDLFTGEQEKVKFYAVKDDESVIHLKALRDDDSAILWKKPLN